MHVDPDNRQSNGSPIADAASSEIGSRTAEAAVVRRNNSLLEYVAAGALILVLASLAWIIIVAGHPTWARHGRLEVEVIVIVGLLTLALLLVSGVALLHTRKDDHSV